MASRIRACLRCGTLETFMRRNEMNRITAASASSKVAKAGLLAGLMFMSAQVSLAQATPPAAPTVLADGAGAKSGRFDNMHKTRFIEIFLAHRDAKSGNFVAECYNSMFTARGIPATKDTAPQAQVEGLDFAGMKTEFGCPTGPRSTWASSGTSTASRPPGSPN
jgi:hypothetical protein